MLSLLSNASILASVEPITVEQYRRMGEAGIIDTGTELIAGVIFRKMIKSPLHTLTVKRLVETLLPQLEPHIELRKEEPLTLDTSEPEPDVALVLKGSYDPISCHPSTALLVIEVAISSEAMDRAKADVYAAANVPEYWLVLPNLKRIERFINPQGESYRDAETIRFDSVISSLPAAKVVVDLRCLNN